MYRAYIKTDPLENPEVVNNLCEQLKSQDVEPYLTERDWQDIICAKPFLYFRNPYLRFDSDHKLLDFHFKNSDWPYLKAANGELLSVSPLAKSNYTFIVNQVPSYYRPKIDPLPILLGTHRRANYLQLTLNSLLYNLHDARQKVYIVVSDPDFETISIIKNTLQNHTRVEAVLVQENLKYACANFGTKFFNLSKFIHYEDDGILPENMHFNLPYWPNQLTYRSTTADLTTLRVDTENSISEILKSDMFYRSRRLKISSEQLWNYTFKDPKQFYPFGGLGLIVDCRRWYQNFKAPTFHKTDMEMLTHSEILCISGIPIYHIGANQKMDYTDYVKSKSSMQVKPKQTGINMRTQETKEIDLSADWALYE